VDVLATRLAQQYPDSSRNLDLRVVPERLARPEEDQSRANALGATIMLAMAILVMVVAGVNVTNLLLARTVSRSGEMAIRSALGAGRLRLVRQMVTETVLLTLLGAGAGLLLGRWTSNALAAIQLPGDLPVRFDFPLDGRVLAYTAALSLLTGLVVGVVSAMRVAGADAMHVLRGARRLSPTHPHRIRGFLVVFQIACCVVLLSVAGVFVRSLFEARRADLGFRPEGVLNFQMDVGQLGYTERRGRAFFVDVERQIRSIPGVQYASFAFTVPMGYVRASASVEAEGQAVDRDSRIVAGTNMVSAEYFETMGIHIVRGRSINDADGEQSPPVAVVNQRLADVLWPGQDAVGRRLRSGGRLIEVVGVAGTGKYQFLFEEPQPYVYVLVAQDGSALVLLGAVVGLLATLSCSRVISRFLFGVPAHDPLTLLSVTLVLTVVALLACIIPAWRFARLDPAIALRSQ
jgi:predicted permease